MSEMPRPRPPHLHRQVTRHGKTVWYVRIGKGPRIRIRREFGTPEFDAEYRAAIDGLPARQAAKDSNITTGTLAWLIERYRETGNWERFVAGDTSTTGEHLQACFGVGWPSTR